MTATKPCRICTEIGCGPENHRLVERVVRMNEKHYKTILRNTNHRHKRLEKQEQARRAFAFLLAEEQRL